jgi:hypothetical protein
MPGRDSLFLLTREEEPFCGIVLKASSVQRNTSKFIKGEIQNDETFAAAAATANHF